MAEDERKRKAPLKTARHVAAKKRAAHQEKAGVQDAIEEIRCEESRRQACKVCSQVTRGQKNSGAEIRADQESAGQQARASAAFAAAAVGPQNDAQPGAGAIARQSARPRQGAKAGQGGLRNPGLHRSRFAAEAAARRALYEALAPAEGQRAVEEGTTPEAAFVRIWQWLMLAAALEGSHVVITPDLVAKAVRRGNGTRSHRIGAATPRGSGFASSSRHQRFSRTQSAIRRGVFRANAVFQPAVNLNIF